MRERVKAVLNGNAQYKNEFMEKMNWVEKTKTRSVSNADVTVSIQLKTKGAVKNSHQVICFTFRNGVIEKLTTTGYIQICVHKNRLFIREADKNIGYKVTTPGYKEAVPGSNVNRYCKMPVLDVFSGFEGNYELKYDDFLELYYIEKGEN